MAVEALKDVLVPILTGTIGLGLGFGLTRLNEKLSEGRARKLAIQHLHSELSNAERHYQLSTRENLDLAPRTNWQRAIMIKKCRFHEGGLGSFDVEALRLFDTGTAERIMDFILIVRNNDYYLDEALLASSADDPSTLAAVLDEVRQRFEFTLRTASRLRERLDERYPARSAPWVGFFRGR